MRSTIFLILLFASVKSFAQTDSSQPKLSFSGYVETYYTYDFGNPANHNRPGFVYAFNRHNEINLDLGFIKAAYETDNLRANLALATGTYMNANYAAEPGVLKNIYEATAGLKISKNKSVWIDAGIMPSHIGFESAVSKECWTLTRSLLADNSPYFETGAKISYTSSNGKWFLSGLVLNGWQRIQRVDGNNSISFGHQLTYKPANNITLNSSSFIGNDKPDSVKQMRYFHNFYGIFQLTEKFAITTGFDIGAEQKFKGSRSFNAWYSPVLIAKISPNAKNSFALRGEYYSDEKGVIIGTSTANGFKTLGYSINYDRLIRENAMFRFEVRGFSSRYKLFMKEGVPENGNLFLTTSLAISL